MDLNLDLAREVSEEDERLLKIIAHRVLGNRDEHNVSIESNFPPTCFKLSMDFAYQFRGMVAYAVKQFIEGMEKVEVLELQYQDEILYRSVEISPSDEERCLLEGGYLVKGEEVNVGVALGVSYGSGRCSVTLFAENEHKETAEKMFEEVRDKIKHANLYKGQKIELSDNGGTPKFIKDTDHRTDEIILGDDIWQEVQENIIDFLEHSEIYGQKGINAKRGVLLDGPPGTGKTLLMKVICSTVPYTCIVLTAAAIESARDVYSAYEFAGQLAPAIVFWEDIDLLAEDRRYNRSLGVLGAILQVMDGARVFKNIVTVASTNNGELLDQAVMQRPARFDRWLNLELPKGEIKERMVKKFLEPFLVDPDVEESVIKATKDFSGAAIKEFVTTAFMNCHRQGRDRIITTDCTVALRKLKFCRNGSDIGLLRGKD